MHARTQRFWPPPGREPIRESLRHCDHPNCKREGEFRAPKSRTALNDYYWFCLDHVRDYNRAWDYCAGLTPEEIEKMVRSDVTWQRASWPLGKLTSGRFFGIDPERVKDHFGLFGEDFWKKKEPLKPAKASPEETAKRVMEIKDPLTLAGLKARYKELCKRYHPDANGGDKASEERFKEIGQAYRTLLASLSY
jgi:hypothetical protein